MKDFIKDLKKGLTIGLGIVLIVGISGVSFAVWNGLNADSGDTLEIGKWNELVNKVSGIYTDGSGNVGIGTTTPKSKLDVNGDIKSNKYIHPSTWSDISKASGITGYIVLLSNNYDTGTHVRSCVYHVLTNNEGTDIAFSGVISTLNGCSSEFRISNGYLQAYPNQAGNWYVGVYRN